MGRIRTVKPQFFLDEDLAELPYSDRLLFIGLWLEADKAGLLEDRPKRIKGALFPYDDLNIDEGLGRLANAGFIVRYEGEGKRLIAVRTFGKHQRPNHREPDSALPPPLGTPVHAQVEGKGMEGKGKEGNGAARTRVEVRAEFERFWEFYPRKIAKDAALAVWERLKPSAELTTQMIEAVKVQAQSPQWVKDGGQFIPHARTWLNQGRWSDKVEVTRTKAPAQIARDEATSEAIRQQQEWRNMTPEQRRQKLAEG